MASTNNRLKKPILIHRQRNWPAMARILNPRPLRRRRRRQAQAKAA